MEVRHLDCISIDEPDSPNASTGEILRSWTPQSPGSNEQNPSRSEFQLTCGLIEILVTLFKASNSQISTQTKPWLTFQTNLRNNHLPPISFVFLLEQRPPSSFAILILMLDFCSRCGLRLRRLFGVCKVAFQPSKLCFCRDNLGAQRSACFVERSHRDCWRQRVWEKESDA